MRIGNISVVSNMQCYFTGRYQSAPDIFDKLKSNITAQTSYLNKMIYNVLGRTHVDLIYSLNFAILCTESVYARCQAITTPTARVCGHFTNYDVTWSTSMKWNLNPLKDSNTYLLFHEFKIMASINCGINSLEIRRSQSSEYSDKYCGDFPAWNESCPCDQIGLTLINPFIHYKTIFSMSYIISQRMAVTVHSYCSNLELPTSTIMPSTHGSVPNTKINIFLTVQVTRMKLIRIFSKPNMGKCFISA